jgi:hypothetical protein
LEAAAGVAGVQRALKRVQQQQQAAVTAGMVLLQLQ